MGYDELLAKIIDDGIAAATEDYAGDSTKLAGVIEGFEACRSKSPQELLGLLGQAATERHRAMADDSDDYWRARCCEAEIEWVCNCVSVLLMSAGEPVIVQPTARAAMKVASVVGVAEAI